MVLGCDGESLHDCIKPFEADFLGAFYQGLARKFGLREWRDGDNALGDAWWALLQAQSADFTLAFRHLADIDERPEAFLSLFSDRSAAQAWLDRYQARLGEQAWPARERRADMLRNVRSRRRNKATPPRSIVCCHCCAILIPSVPVCRTTPCRHRRTPRASPSVARLDE
jgi:uncharacterized protein YdiU (UPF0061 family)